MIVDMGEVNLPGEVKQNIAECGQLIDVGVF
jgi:hypothetical protein